MAALRPHGLRGRLLAYGAVVAAAGLAVQVAVFSRGVAVEIRELRSDDSSAPIAPIATDLAGRLRSRLPPPTGAGDELAGTFGAQDLSAELAAVRDAAREMRTLLLVDRRGRLIAAAPPLASPADITLVAEDHFRITWQAAPGQTQEIELRGPAGRVEPTPGQPIGNLVALPAADPLPPPGPGQLARALGRWFALALLLATVVALPLGWWLAHHITRPLARLTAAVRRLRAGELAAQVAVGGPAEISELTRAFNAMATDLAHADAARRRMVADVAHELRTPITRLQVQLEALEDGMLPPAPTLTAVQADVRLLARLVNDLQDLALADAQRLSLRASDVELGELARDVVASATAVAERSGVRFAVQSAGPLWIRGDRERLRQILGNLLDNAVAWSPPGGLVEIALERREAHARLVVRDHGAGIAAQHLPHLFERFYRADPARRRHQTGGAGLGLALVQALVAAHGGRVEAGNRADGGAQFSVELPLGAGPCAFTSC